MLGQDLDDVVYHCFSLRVIFLIAADVGLNGVGNDELHLTRDGCHFLTYELLHLALKMGSFSRK